MINMKTEFMTLCALYLVQRLKVEFCNFANLQFRGIGSAQENRFSN
jgi:hypothetical protein